MLIGVLLLGGLAAGAAMLAGPDLKSPFSQFFQSSRPDLVLHKVRPEFLAVTVVERGTLESAENKDVVCKVKAGSKGTYASTVRWVIDDGTLVKEGQLLMELDDSALQDQYLTQSIAVDKARAEWEKADSEHLITVKQNQSDLALTEAALRVAELDVDKYLGIRIDPMLEPVGAIAGALSTLVERGEYRQLLDDVSGRLKLAEADLESYRDRAAWAERSARLGYQTDSQARAEQSKLASALDNVEKLRKEKYVLETFLRRRNMTDLTGKLDVARFDYDRAQKQAIAKESQAESSRRTAYSVYQQELQKLRDIEEQIRQCRIVSPQDGMVVYYKESGSRWSNNNEGLIQQGAQVKEGQKMLRIPDLRRMQVNTRVHEAMVSRIRGDDRRSTGQFEALQSGLLLTPSFGRVVALSDGMQDLFRVANRLKPPSDRYYEEYVLNSQGQAAAVRIDAFPTQSLRGHVRSVAAVASQQDWASSDVRVYQTLVTIDDYLEGLKPDMSAEVTIMVDPPTEPVLAVPVQAIVGGAESGEKRKVFVLTPTGPEAREVISGIYNERMVEIKEGVKEGEEVVLNPKVLLEPGAKTREEGGSENGRRPGMPGGKSFEGKMKGGKGGGMGKAGMPGADKSTADPNSSGGGGTGNARPKQ